MRRRRSTLPDMPSRTPATAVILPRELRARLERVAEQMQAASISRVTISDVIRACVLAHLPVLEQEAGHGTRRKR